MLAGRRLYPSMVPWRGQPIVIDDHPRRSSLLVVDRTMMPKVQLLAQPAPRLLRGSLKYCCGRRRVVVIGSDRCPRRRRAAAPPPGGREGRVRSSLIVGRFDSKM